MIQISGPSNCLDAARGLAGLDWSGLDFVALAKEGGRATGGFGQLARELARVDSDVARVTPGAKDSRPGKDGRSYTWRLIWRRKPRSSLLVY